MANPQINELIDYIKKAKEAGQTDDQTRQILAKNGWSVTEIGEAFAVTAPVNKPQQPVQTQTQPQVAVQPKIQPQAQPQPQYQPKPMQSSMPKIRKSHLALKLCIILIILVILGGAEYFIVWQSDLLKNPVVENEVKVEPQPTQLNLATAKIISISQDYDITKGVAAALFSKIADKVAYCAMHKTTKKIDCFLNNEKLSNSYNYNPYWIGISPDGSRVVFLYLDPIKKQSFIFENGAEGARYNGTITSPAVSSDSKNLLYVVMGKDGKSFVVLNEKPFAPHDKIYGVPIFSADGKYVLYGARDGQDIFWVADEIK